MNYSEEEKEAIEYFKSNLEMTKEMGKRWGFEEEIKNNETVLNLIQKQESIIDKMAEQLNKFHSLRGLDDDCFIPREYSDINDCIKKQSCKECIKEYFKKVVDEDVED